MATVDKSIDLTMNSDDDASSVDSYDLRQARKLGKETQNSKSKPEVIDLAEDSKAKERNRAAPRSFANAMALSPGPEKQSPLNRNSSRKPRIGSFNANGKDQDQNQSASSPPRKAEESAAQLSSPSAKRLPTLGATSDNSSLRKQPSSEKSLRQRKLSSSNTFRTPPSGISSINGSLEPINGDRQEINGDHTKSSSKLLNGHKATENTSKPSSTVSSIRTNSRIARKSSAPARAFAIPSLGGPSTHASPLNKSSLPPSHTRLASASSEPRLDAQAIPRASPAQRLETKVDEALPHQFEKNIRHQPNGHHFSQDSKNPPKTQDEFTNVIMSDTPALKDSLQPAELAFNEGTSPVVVKEETPIISGLSISDFEQRLKDYMAKLRADHQYHVRSRLSQARRRSETQSLRSNSEKVSAPFMARSSGGSQTPRDFIHTKSPFFEMKSIEHEPLFPKSRLGKLGQYVAKTPAASKPVVSYPVVAYRSGGAAIPPYTAYISTKRNVLIEDDKHRTFLPYLGETFDVDIADADYVALETKIEGNQRNYHKMNRIMEKASVYAPFVDDFLKDIGSSSVAVLEFLLDESGPAPPSDLPLELADYWQKRIDYLEKEGYYEDQDDSDVTSRRKSDPDNVKKKKPEKQWRQLFANLPNASTGHELAAACLACYVFQKVTGISLFHVVKQYQSEQEKLSPHLAVGMDEDTISVRDYTVPDLHSLGTYAELVCQVCKVHECPGHGEYEDTDDDKNLRIRVNLKPTVANSPNRKFGSAKSNKASFDKELDIKELMGLEEDGKTVNGPLWASQRDSADSGFGDHELCSEDCFWPKDSRPDHLSVWSEEDLKNLKMLRPAFENDKRGACMIAQTGLVSKPCNEIFLMLYETIPVSTRYSMRAYNDLKAAKTKMPPRRNHDYWLENPTTSMTYMQHKREPFLPCNHTGPCDEKADCDCFKYEITCEKSCACSEACTRRYQGCRCAQKGKSCRFNERCDCWRLNRECDPDLCRSCGAHEVLDPANRRNDKAIQGKCTNVYIQRGVPKRTLLGPSKLMAAGSKQGWGLYMGEECKKWDYIGEYRGEIISDVEADLRGTIYDKRNMSYLFTLNQGQTLDSTLMGNKLRFINHQADPFANCLAKLMLCNSVQRIGMFALKDIGIGEEMYFNYGSSFAAKFDLIKLNHDGPPTIEHPPKPSSISKTSRHSKRSTELSSTSTSSGTNPYRQMKNTLSKNGLRIGRPPKHPLLDDQASSSAMLNSEDPMPGPSRKRDKRNSKKRRRSEAVLDEDSEDEEYVDPHLTVTSRPYFENLGEDSEDDQGMSAVEDSEDSSNDMEVLKQVLATRGSRRDQVGSDSEEDSKHTTPSSGRVPDDDAMQESSSLVEESQEEMPIATALRSQPRKPRKPRKDKGIPRGPMKDTGKKSASSSTQRRRSKKAENGAEPSSPLIPKRKYTTAMKSASKPATPSNGAPATSPTATTTPGPQRKLKLFLKSNPKDTPKGRGSKSSPFGLDGAGDEKSSESSSDEEDGDEEESEDSEEEEEYDEEVEEEEHETPQKRGWRTRHANMAREQAAREKEKERRKAGRKRGGGRGGGGRKTD